MKNGEIDCEHTSSSSLSSLTMCSSSSNIDCELVSEKGDLSVVKHMLDCVHNKEKIFSNQDTLSTTKFAYSSTKRKYFPFKIPNQQQSLHTYY